MFVSELKSISQERHYVWTVLEANLKAYRSMARDPQAPKQFTRICQLIMARNMISFCN